MPKRVRLTERRNREAVDGNIAYPGNVNQPDRKFKDWEQYHTFEQHTNHELPDMQHDWKNDERDDIGFGIPEPWGQSPTVASVRVAANKAVKLAYFLLGNKVAENVIEDQANDFMLLGPEAIDRTLARFAETGELYAQEDEDEDEDEGDAKEASEKKAQDDEDEDEDEDDAKEASEKKASEKKAQDDEDEDEDEDDAKEASEKKAQEDEDDAKEASEKKAQEDEDEDEDEGDAKEASLDFELGPTASDEEPEADERLASLFDDDIPKELPEPGAGQREASEKKGVKTLGGQPRVAGNGGESQDISSIWASAPDVSDIFR